MILIKIHHIKLIIFGYRYSLWSTSKNTMVCMSTKTTNGEKCSEITRGHISEITETARLSGWKFTTDKSRCSSYITRHWNWMHSYWMFCIGGLSWRFSLSSFCEFWKITFCDSPHFPPFPQEYPFDFSDVLHQEYFSLYVSKTLSMINSNFEDFNERRSEEVISFFWCSVYISTSMFTSRINSKLSWLKMYLKVLWNIAMSDS